MISSNFDDFKKKLESGLFKDCFFEGGSLWKVKNSSKTRLKGLTKFCKEKFWPSFDFDEVYSISKKTTPKQKSRTPLETDKWNVVQGQSPQVRGKMIHDQIRLLVMGINVFKKKYTVIDSMTMLAVEWLKKEKLDCFVPELCIGDEFLRLGTSIDLLAKNEKDELILIEWKTGNPSVFTISNSQMEALPLGIKTNNCLYHQARIQVLMSCALLYQNYGICVDRAYIVLLTNHERYAMEINPEFLKCHKLMYKHVYENF